MTCARGFGTVSSFPLTTQARTSGNAASVVDAFIIRRSDMYIHDVLLSQLLSNATTIDICTVIQ